MTKTKRSSAILLVMALWIGFLNIANANSQPSAPADTTPPTANLSIGSFIAPSKVNITLTATDDVGGSGVTGYMVKFTAKPPSKSSLNWKAAPPTKFTFPITATSGPQTIYAWAKDKAGNVSATVSASVDLDVKKPVVTTFSATRASEIVGTITFSTTATDPVVNGVASGVVGYMVTTSDTPPSRLSLKWSPGPVPGIYYKGCAPMFYAWVKDANGNVSKPKSARNPWICTGLTPMAGLPNSPWDTAETVAAPIAQPGATTSRTSQASKQDDSADLTMVVGTWFKISIKNMGYYNNQLGLTNDRKNIPGYLKIWDWDEVNKVLQGDLYQYDAQLDQWTSEPLLLNYTSGDALDFEAWSQVIGDLTYGFTARIRGTQTSGALTEATFRTLGGYHVQRDNQQGSTRHFAGWFAISGKMVSESEVQVPADILQH